MQTSPSGTHVRASQKPALGLLARLRQRSEQFNGLLTHEWGLLIGFVLALFLFLVLFSYDPRDAGFFSSGTAEGKLYNWGDATGAWIASFLLFLFGVFAYAVPFGVALVSWVVFRIRVNQTELNRRQLLISSASLFLLLSTGAALASLYLNGQDWFVPLPYSGGGMWGYALAQFMVSAIDRLATTLLLLSFFALAFSWIVGISLLQLVDVTGEVLWLSWHWTLENWQDKWKPGLLAFADLLVEKYQAWRRGERVLPTQQAFIAWLITTWSDLKAHVAKFILGRPAVPERPVGEHFKPAELHETPSWLTKTVSIPGLVQPISDDVPQRVVRTVSDHDNRLYKEPSVTEQDEQTLKPITPIMGQSAESEAPPSSEHLAAMMDMALKVRDDRGVTLVGETKQASLPSLSLLDEIPKQVHSIDKSVLESMGVLLEQTLKEYNIKADVVGIVSGPVVTLFELQPAPGVKVGSITNLAKDLARSMSVLAVRVVDIIPGKSVIGIEIPNPVQESISFREVLSSDVYQHTSMTLPLVMGKDTAGRPVVADLAKMPHALVAGQTGSGKSVGVNAMIVSLLYHATADEVKFIMIDPKMLELSVYEGIPHLLAPVVTDMSEAANALRWCVVEMERRYQLMSKLGVRNIAGYNEKVQAAIDAGKPIIDPTATMPMMGTFDMAPPMPTLEPLPYIVVIVDEFADLFMVVGKKIEELIARLAQKARAAGIHLVLATQRPSVDVVTGLIKANIPARVSFKVASKIDSRTILDQMGADQLLGRGDMLYLGNGMSIPQRVHGPFVSDDEVHRVVEFLKTQGTPEYVTLDPAAALGGGGSASLTGLFDDEAGGAEKDVLYDEAVAFVIEARRVSVSSVQRRFKIGYNRAARIVEAMEAAGLVSAQQPNGNREVLGIE
ncbi:MAG TPA: DNA translocase FtsK 4TM domain-containing protein [Thiotrichales bacterium]|nr:DNA translocase FtsK 4TM domain-containing protein [Thiotrichales bacterium]